MYKFLNLRTLIELMEPFGKIFNTNGASASTTHESVSTPEESPIKQCQTPHFKETS